MKSRSLEGLFRDDQLEPIDIAAWLRHSRENVGRLFDHLALTLELQELKRRKKVDLDATIADALAAVAAGDPFRPPPPRR